MNDLGGSIDMTGAQLLAKLRGLQGYRRTAEPAGSNRNSAKAFAGRCRSSCGWGQPIEQRSLAARLRMDRRALSRTRRSAFGAA